MIHWDETHARDPSDSWKLWLMPRLLANGVLTMTVYWLYDTEQGLGIYSISYTGYHVLFMTCFAVLTNMESTLSFAIPLCGIRSSRDTWRNTHIICNFLGIACIIFGIISISYYRYPWYNYLYHPHAIMGWVSILMYMFIFPLRWCCPKSVRAHQALGLCLYVSGIMTCMLGYQSKQDIDFPLYLNATGTINPSSNWNAYQSMILILLLLGSGISTMLVFFSTSRS